MKQLVKIFYSTIQFVYNTPGKVKVAIEAHVQIHVNSLRLKVNTAHIGVE